MIQPIVEGHGEVEAVRVLLQRLTKRLLPHPISYLDHVAVGRPIRRHKSELVQEGGFKRAIGIASGQEGVQAIFLLFDADDDCARTHIPNMLRWSAQEAAHLPCGAVMARREYEAWFLAAITSLRGKRGIRPDAAYTKNPEAKGDAKGTLRRLTEKASYRPTADQLELSAVFDLGEAYRNASSFRKLVKELCRVLEAIGQQPSLPPGWDI